MEKISLTSAIVDCYMTQHNWMQFVAEGHSITYRDPQSGSLPFNQQCPSCRAKAMHTDQDKQVYHSGDQIFCLNLFTPGTDPDNWKDTGIQCIRVQHPTREGAINLMQMAIIDTVYAFGRQEFGKAVAQEQLNRLKLQQDQFHIFMAENLPIPEGDTPLGVAARFIRSALKDAGKPVKTDANEILPQSWRRD